MIRYPFMLMAVVLIHNCESRFFGMPSVFGFLGRPQIPTFRTIHKFGVRRPFPPKPTIVTTPLGTPVGSRKPTLPASDPIHSPKTRIVQHISNPLTNPKGDFSKGAVPGPESAYQAPPDFVEPSRDWIFHYSKNKNKNPRYAEPLMIRKTIPSAIYLSSNAVAKSREPRSVRNIQPSTKVSPTMAELIASPLFAILQSASLNRTDRVSIPYSNQQGPNNVVWPVPGTPKQNVPSSTLQRKATTNGKLVHMLFNNLPTQTKKTSSPNRGTADALTQMTNRPIVRQMQLIKPNSYFPQSRMYAMFDPRFFRTSNPPTGYQKSSTRSRAPPRTKSSLSSSQANALKKMSPMQLAYAMRTRRFRNMFPPEVRAKLFDFLRRLDIVGKVDAAREMECLTMPEVLGLNIYYYHPMRCRSSKRCPGETVCRNTSNVGFCCPVSVKTRDIHSKGFLERRNALTDLFMP